jgi:hypothetical protein
MLIVDSFVPWLQVFFLSMTEPSGRLAVEFMTGWLFSPGRSLGDRIRASGQHSRSAYYRLLTAARWSVDEVSWRLLSKFLQWFPQDTLYLIGDDTLLPRKGPRVYAAGMHRDPLRSTRTHTIKCWGHCWVVLGVGLSSRRDPSHWYCLPVLMRLYLNQRTAKNLGRPYRTKSDLMIEMVTELERRWPQQKLHFIGDYSYTTPSSLRRLPVRVEVTGRLNRRAQFYESPPPRTGRRGRPKVRGKRLPSPQQMWEGRTTQQRVKIAPGRCYRIRVASQVGCFYSLPERKVKVIALQHIGRPREKEAFYSTVLDASVTDILRQYSQRWAIETTFHDCKQHLHIGAARSRTRPSVERAAAMGFHLYSLIVLWHETRRTATLQVRSYRGKRHPSFADMLVTLRDETLLQNIRPSINHEPQNPANLQKIIAYLEHLLALAA